MNNKSVFEGCQMCEAPKEDKYVQTTHRIHNKGDYNKAYLAVELVSGGTAKPPVIRIESGIDNAINATEIQIQYCPYCGRKLTEHEPSIIKNMTVDGKLYVGNL